MVYQFVSSSGTGSIGVVIGMDILLDEAENENSMDIYKCVELMVKQRPGLIHTEVSTRLLVRFPHTETQQNSEVQI